MPRSRLLPRATTFMAAAALFSAGLLWTPTAVSAAAGQVFYVSPGGNDGNPGTSSSAPLRTLQSAQGKVRSALTAGTVPSVQVGAGTYELAAPLAFGPADSGAAGSPVVWQTAPGAQVVLAGGRQVQPAWSPDPARPGVYTAQIGTGISMDGLFVNGKRQVLARYPNVDQSQAILDGYTSLAAEQAEARAKGWKHPGLADLRALHCNSWGGASFKVTGLNSDGTLGLSWVGDNNPAVACPNPSLPLDPNHVVVENVLEELDAPGEWYYDGTAGTLYFYPPAGTSVSGTVVQTAESDEFIHVEGTSNTAAARDITFSGFTYMATHRTLFDHAYEGLQLGDWSVARTCAFYTKNAANISVTRSAFDY
jgi:hypothetical protein